jgi:chromosome partitioning protein
MPLSGDTATTIPILNNKGGIGKTTTAVNLAAALSRIDQSVPLVDMDSQASASLSLGLERSALSPSVTEVLFDETSIETAIRALPSESFDLLPASLGLSEADTRLFESDDRHHRLTRALDEVDPLYDIVILDCPPSTSLLTLNAMIAGDALIIPVSPGYLALEGIVQLGDVITQVRSNLGDATPVLGLLLTMVERDAEESAVISQVRDHYGEKVFATEIRTDPALRRAAAEGTSIFTHAPSSPGREDHSALAQEVLERIKQYSATPSPSA